MRKYLKFTAIADSDNGHIQSDALIDICKIDSILSHDDKDKSIIIIGPHVIHLLITFDELKKIILDNA